MELGKQPILVIIITIIIVIISLGNVVFSLFIYFCFPLFCFCFSFLTELLRTDDLLFSSFVMALSHFDFIVICDFFVLSCFSFLFFSFEVIGVL